MGFDYHELESISCISHRILGQVVSKAARYGQTGMTRHSPRALGGGLVVAVASLAGAAAFLFPFLLPALA
ncbi:MAG: hypothetical protein IT337_08280, partial [Thermomicrobiales bacterium]|nr:hypothetical protein [Thermomicrobiales bacterium]